MGKAFKMRLAAAAAAVVFVGGFGVAAAPCSISVLKQLSQDLWRISIHSASPPQNTPMDTLIATAAIHAKNFPQLCITAGKSPAAFLFRI